MWRLITTKTYQTESIQGIRGVLPSDLQETYKGHKRCFYLNIGKVLKRRNIRPVIAPGQFIRKVNERCKKLKYQYGEELESLKRNMGPFD